MITSGKKMISHMRNMLLAIGICWLTSAAFAANAPLPVGQAFPLTAFIDQNQQVILQWDIAPGYYLYRAEIQVTANPGSQATPGALQLPEGQTKRDEFHGVFQSYIGTLVAKIPITGQQKGDLNWSISYQGCSAGGFCYPPVKQALQLNLANVVGPMDVTDNVIDPQMHQAVSSPPQQDWTQRLLVSHHYFYIIPVFLGVGILLAFTPCVLPMVPILSSIIAGCGATVTSRKAFLLSLAYVLGMALFYANAGMIAAYAGRTVQAFLQQPWIIGLLSAFFVLLALSLFGSYNLRLPARLQQWLAACSQRHQGGTYVGVFFMGGFSTLVVSPCISAPLVGVLTYIANSGDVVLGGTALLALGLGMGLPLLMVGTAAGRFLPKAGGWMEKIKHLFGFLMLGMAIWMLSRVVSAALTLYLWALLVVCIAIFLWRLRPVKRRWWWMHKGLSVSLLSYALLLVASTYWGWVGEWNPLTAIMPGAMPLSSPFTVVKNKDQLEQALALAKREQKEVLLDFYADWCASCVVMDHHVFNQPAVKDHLKKFILLRADVTQNNTFDHDLEKRYHVVAPPTVVFLNTAGKQLQQDDIVGEVNAAEFVADVGRVRDHLRINYCQSNLSDC